MSEASHFISQPSDRQALNLAIVGGGRACKFFLELLQNELFANVDIRIVAVCDINPEAEGLRLANEMGIYTTDNFEDLFKFKKLDGLIELTGNREILLELIRLRPKGLGILEHNIGGLLRNLLLKEQQSKSAEEQVLFEKMAIDFLMRQVNERISVLNPDFSIVEANEAYLKAAGKSKEEVVGAHCYQISHGLSAPCSSAQPGVGCPLLETLRTGESAHVIHEHFLSGEHPTYCDLVTYPLRDQNDEIVRVIEIGRDLTDELSSRWETRAKTIKDDFKRLIQEDRMISLGKLVASSVHEINNPIQGLLTFSHLMGAVLEEGELDSEGIEKFKKYISLMCSELERCGSIVSSLLSFSRQKEMAYRNVNLNDILSQVVELTRHKMEIQDINLNTELYPRPLIINGDLNQLQECLLNLIFNAIEAMPNGGELLLTSRLDEKDRNTLIEIKDTGCGIAPENLDHIFDPFFTTKHEGEGTGLGLSIVYGVVRNHEGNIKVDSQEGRGTRFILSFPLQCAMSKDDEGSLWIKK